MVGVEFGHFSELEDYPKIREVSRMLQHLSLGIIVEYANLPNIREVLPLIHLSQVLLHLFTLPIVCATSWIDTQQLGTKFLLIRKVLGSKTLYAFYQAELAYLYIYSLFDSHLLFFCCKSIANFSVSGSY